MAIDVTVVEKQKGQRYISLDDTRSRLGILMKMWPPVNDPETGAKVLDKELVTTIVYSGPPNGYLWALAHKLKKGVPGAHLETILPNELPF